MSKVFDEPTDCKRILRELVILKSTRGSKGLVNLIEILPPDDPLNFEDIYVVLEYAPCDLKKLIKQNRYLTMNQIRKIMVNLLLALCELHSMNIVHRDIKPANVLIFDDLSIKICDFGLARSIINLK